MNKKILMILMIGMVLISSASAFDFDNVLEYENSDMKVKFKNGFGFGRDLGTIELKSHTSETEVKGFGWGKEEVVMYYDFTNWEFYENGLGEVIFTDMNINETIQKDYYFVEWKEVDVPNYITSCNDNNLGNGTILQNCERVESGTKKEFQWINYKSLDIPEGDSRIGLKTYVGKDDYIDGVWTIVGKKVKKHITWTGDLASGQVSYWKMDEGSGTLLDEQGNNTLAIAGLQYSQPGATINTGTSINFTVGDATAFKNNPVGMEGTVMSGTLWLRVDARTNLDTIFAWSGATEGSLWMADPDLLQLKMQDGTGTDEVDVVYTSYMNTWTFVYWEINATIIRLYINNTLVDSAVADFSGLSVSNFTIGQHPGGTRDYRGGLDEVSIFNRLLSVEEQTYLWEDGVYCAYGDDTCGNEAPNITLEKPDNGTVFLTDSISMNCTVFDLIGSVINVSLILDGVVSETNSSGINNSLYNFDKVLSLGDHNWTCRAFDDDSDSATADTRFFNINVSVATELISPDEGENLTESLVNFVVNSTPTNQDLVSMSPTVWFSNGTLAFTNSTTLSGSAEVQTTVTPIILDGNYIWGATTTGTITTNTTSNRTFTVHTTPSTINITFPTGNIQYFILGENLTLNWSITEPGQNLSEHIINCSFTYNSIKIDLNQSQCIEINETSFLYVNGIDNLSFTVLEEFDLTTTNTTSWTFSLLELNQSFVNETIEGASNDFDINYSIGSGLIVSAAVLWYGGDSNLAVTSDFGGGTLGATASEIVAQSVDADSNISFHWSFIFSGGSQINTTSRNQTVLNLSIDDCSVNTHLIYNYTIVDEETQLKINETSLELSINIFDLSREFSIINFSQDYGSTNPGVVCLNISLTNATAYSLDSIAKYSSTNSTGYAIEYYNLLNFTLANNTVDADITLYDLNLSDSTDFQLTYRDENLAFDPDIRILVNRQYISEDVFKIVEIPITDSKGQTVLHLVRSDVVYNLIMVDIQGNIVATFNKVRAFCQDFTIGDCSLSLNADRGVDTVLDITSTVGITYGLSYVNSSSILSLEFISNDLTPKKVSLQVIRNTDFGNRTVCLEDLTSSSGILTCNLTDVGERYLFLDILVDDEFIGTNTLDKGANASGVYGTEGYFMAFLIILLLITMFSDQKQVLVFSLLIGWIAVISLSLISGGLFGLFSSGIWLVITIALYLWKLRGETV